MINIIVRNTCLGLLHLRLDKTLPQFHGISVSIKRAVHLTNVGGLPYLKTALHVKPVY